MNQEEGVSIEIKATKATALGPNPSLSVDVGSAEKKVTSRTLAQTKGKVLRRTVISQTTSQNLQEEGETLQKPQVSQRHTHLRP